MILGRPSRADQAQYSVETYAAVHFPGVDVTVDRIEAVWGEWYALPMLVVTLPDCYMLLDTTKGRVGGGGEVGGQHAYGAGLCCQHGLLEYGHEDPDSASRGGCAAPCRGCGCQCWL
jgi:hypothetical protein